MGIYWFSHGGLRAAYWRFCLPNLFLLVEDGALSNQSLLVEAGASTQSASSCRRWGLPKQSLHVEDGALLADAEVAANDPFIDAHAGYKDIADQLDL